MVDLFRSSRGKRYHPRRRRAAGLILANIHLLILARAEGDTFRFFIPLAELPAEGSFAASLFKGGIASLDFVAVPVEAWLDRQAAEKVETLLEHSVYLPNYNAVLTLLWAYKTSATPLAEGEDSLLDELDPQGFTLGRRKWPR